MNEEIKEILEEISNDENYSNFIDGQSGGAKYYLLLEKIEGKQLVNYITNLQKENQKLKEDIDAIKLFHFDLVNMHENLIEKYLDYKSRNEKAIEYIENNKDKEIATYGGDYDYETCLFKEDIDDLLNILQGGDE